MWLESTELSEKIIGVENEHDIGLVVLNTKTELDTEITHSKPFDIVCAELCGANHYAMRGMLYVVKESEYEQFLFLNIDNTLRASIKAAKRKRKNPTGKAVDRGVGSDKNLREMTCRRRPVRRSGPREALASGSGHRGRIGGRVV